MESESSESENAASLDLLELLGDPFFARLPEKCGWLLKRTGNPFRHWQPRYFRLKDKKLNYYHRQADEKPAGSLNFDLISVNLQLVRSGSRMELTIQPVFSDRLFRLRAEEPGDLENWALLISEHISASAGRFTNVTSVSRQAKFWRWNRISNSQFKALAATGDILLFSGKNLAAKAQRFVTRSKYDHVALILKYNTNQLALLEATSMDVCTTQGVQVLLWNEFLRMRWHLLYTRLVFRRLECERSEEMLHSLEAFIMEVRGKKFNLSPAKLIRKRGDPSVEDAEGYFCSELLATAYKRIGLLPDDLSSSQYWPGQFSTEKKLELLGEARLGEELLIDFEQEDPVAV